MSIPRISIRVMLLGIVWIAVECSIFQWVLGTHSQEIVMGTFGDYLMFHFLAYIIYRNYWRRAMGQPFFTGFVLSGASAMLVWFYFCLFADESWLKMLLGWIDTVPRNFLRFVALGSRFGQDEHPQPNRRLTHACP